MPATQLVPTRIVRSDGVETTVYRKSHADSARSLVVATPPSQSSQLPTVALRGLMEHDFCQFAWYLTSEIGREMIEASGLRVTSRVVKSGRRDEDTNPYGTFVAEGADGVLIIPFYTPSLASNELFIGTAEEAAKAGITVGEERQSPHEGQGERYPFDAAPREYVSRCISRILGDIEATDGLVPLSAAERSTDFNGNEFIVAPDDDHVAFCCRCQVFIPKPNAILEPWMCLVCGEQSDIFDDYAIGMAVREGSRHIMERGLAAVEEEKWHHATIREDWDDSSNPNRLIHLGTINSALERVEHYKADYADDVPDDEWFVSTAKVAGIKKLQLGYDDGIAEPEPKVEAIIYVNRVEAPGDVSLCVPVKRVSKVDTRGLVEVLAEQNQADS